MKKMIYSILLALGLIGSTGYSQNSTPWYTDIYNAVKDSGIAQATNYSFEPYLTYAPQIAKKSDRIGGGFLALYNLNNNVAAGIGFDYLGRFSLVSANLTLKLPIKPFEHISLVKAGWLKELVVTPFVLGGVGKPLGGTSADVSVIEDMGAAVSFGHLWGGKLNTGVVYGSWINAGDYSGKRYHVFFGWSKDF